MRRRITFISVSTSIILVLVMLLVAGRLRMNMAPVILPASVNAQMREGDVIFRIGSEWQGFAVRSVAGRGDPYSHVGLVIGTPAHWQVLHSVPSEHPGQPDVVVLDDMDFFLASKRTRAVAIYHVTASDKAHANAVLNAKKRIGSPFRIVANDTEGQYCTTFVWRAWREAGVDLGVRFNQLNVPFAAGEYLSPHSLRISPLLCLLYESDVNIAKLERAQTETRHAYESNTTSAQ